MGKNILEKLLAEYDRNIGGILKKYGEKDGLDEIVGVFRFLSCTESLGRYILNIVWISAYKPRDHTRLTQKSCGNLCNLVVPTTSYPSMYLGSGLKQ